MSFSCCLKMEIRTQSVTQEITGNGHAAIVTNRDNQGISKLVNRLTTELFPEDFANQAAPSPGAACFFEAKPVKPQKDTRLTQRKPDTEIIVVVPGGKLLGALSFL
jgi:hypothetical protein